MLDSRNHRTCFRGKNYQMMPTNPDESPFIHSVVNGIGPEVLSTGAENDQNLISKAFTNF
jgi:hypothetical protein